MDNFREMKGTDKQVRVLIILALLIHISVIIFGILFNTAARLMAATNLFFGSLLLLYWIKKQFTIRQHVFELREMVALLAEAFLLVLSLYSLFHADAIFPRYMQLAGFGVHLLLIIAFMAFMLTFKIKRLF